MATRKRNPVSLGVEHLEERWVPSTFTVTNLNSSGAGSLAQAIITANTHPGADLIDFSVAGSIKLAAPLPAVIGTVDIDGTSAPGYAGAPVVQVNFNHLAGLHFTPTSGGSELNSLDLVNAAAAGVTINNAGGMLIVGNIIGLGLNGTSLAGNGGNGLVLNNSSGNTIGGSAAEQPNTISGNLGNGLVLNGSSNNNQIVGNFIGTDVTGAVGLGNTQNGILITGGAKGNEIGGTATGGNDPTNSVYVRPPQGNVISGNNGNGVLITGGATQNVLNGNFIGTDVTGDVAIGNTLDGVAIQGANGNSLAGCTITTNPFVFYNVISGNGGNGLSILNSNNTIVQGNFFGVAANNQTALGNRLNGVIVEGTSAHTTMGGPIPLGNVSAANGLNGIVVKDTASFFVSYNTFCGGAAFQTYTDLGNGHDGMLITSTGGNILLRTNVIVESGNDGIEIGGLASGVRVAGNIVGLDTNGDAPMGNKNNGVEVDGGANNNIIGGPNFTFNIIPHNAISANGGNGVAITGNAHNNLVNFSDIGTDLLGDAALGNAKAGVYVGTGAYANSIGSPDPNLISVISGNLSDGVSLSGTHGNTVIGNLIGTGILGAAPLPNGGNGVLLVKSSNNVIGRIPSAIQSTASTANLIAFNDQNGVFVASGTGNAIGQNSIFGNTRFGIDLGPGANKNQPAPVVSGIQKTALGLKITGTLTAAPSTAYTVEFYANDQSDPSGRYYLGAAIVHTNANGTGSFTFNSPPPPNGANFVTATATDQGGNTSEFSTPESIGP